MNCGSGEMDWRGRVIDETRWKLWKDGFGRDQEFTTQVVLIFILSFAMSRCLFWILDGPIRRFFGVELTGARHIGMLFLCLIVLPVQENFLLTSILFGYWFIKVIFNVGADEMWKTV